jgi:hypothetical protein
LFGDEILYNQYVGLGMMPYKIITHLLLNNEDIFKLLKYNENNALDLNNLSISEKRNLIYKGQTDSSPYKIFMQPTTDDAFPDTGSFLRVYIVDIYPTDHIKGLVTIAFEILCHNKINSLNNYSTRMHWMLQNILSTFNGANIDGIGELFFNAKASNRMNYAKQNLYNGKNYFGYTICMSTWCGNVKE